MSQNDDNGYTQAIAQADSVAAMVAALECDYDRLEELRESVSGDVVIPDEFEELAELEEAANGCKDADEARERIQEDALDAQVRGGWYNPCDSQMDAKADEFMILLCTGGPAVRIMGELDEHMQPCRAWIEYQDWFKPWQELSGHIEMSTLLTYCQQYYFGE